MNYGLRTCFYLASCVLKIGLRDDAVSVEHCVCFVAGDLARSLLRNASPYHVSHGGAAEVAQQ